MSLGNCLLVAAGAFIGTIARASLDLSLSPYQGINFAVICVNILGAALLGAVNCAASARARLFWGTGLCGAFTTYSAFALMLTRTHPLLAVALGFALLGAGFAAYGVGQWVAQRGAAGWGARGRTEWRIGGRK